MQGSVRWAALAFAGALAMACGNDESGSGGSGGSGGGAQGGSGGSGGSAQGGSGGSGGSAQGGSGQGGSGGVTTGCGTATSAAIRDCVETSRLEQDLNFIAQNRPPGSPHWQAVQDLCRDRFEQNGFTVELHNYGSGVNVIGTKPGTERPDEQVLISAHYDHIPNCAGADDNATGVAGVLEAARIMGPASFARTVVLACWDQEEQGLIGAEAYAARARQQGQNIAMMVSLEMLGFRSFEPNSQRVPFGFDLLFPVQLAELEANQNRGDFLAVFPDTAAAGSANQMAAHAEAIGLPVFVLEITDALKSNPVAGDVRRSDHAAFWDQDYPAILATDTSEFRYDPYHCRGGTTDVVQNLDMEFFTLNTKAILGGSADTAEVR